MSARDHFFPPSHRLRESRQLQTGCCAVRSPSICGPSGACAAPRLESRVISLSEAVATYRAARYYCAWQKTTPVARLPVLSFPTAQLRASLVATTRRT